jgi:hypothetical protein
MMLDIVRKLEHELSLPIESERQVAYILIELRKLLELEKRARNEAKQPQDHTYATLQFCCDWAVHPVMDYENGKRIVRRFDEWQEYLDRLHAAKDGDYVTPIREELMREINETLTLARFRDQLARFLAKQGLTNTIATDTDRWTSFLTYYIPIIEDCPLICEDEGLQYTDRVLVEVAHSRAQKLGDEIPISLAIQWNWASKATGVPQASQYII